MSIKNYDELVKRLRSRDGWALNQTLDEAADTIEELQQSVSHYNTLCDAWETVVRHLQQMIKEMSDEHDKQRPASQNERPGTGNGDMQ